MSTCTADRLEAAIPLHTYLHRRVQEIPGLTNVKVAEALGYEKPNVVAMMVTGSMKVPLNKVKDLARVLELDPLSLLRRVLMAYSPDMWDTIEEIVGRGTLVTANEIALVGRIRELIGEEDVPLHRDAQFMSELTMPLIAAQGRFLRTTLATRRDDVEFRDTKVGRANAAMLNLLRRQARERADLLRLT